MNNRALRYVTRRAIVLEEAMRLTMRNADDRGALIAAAREYAEAVAADDLRVLRDQARRSWEYAGDFLDGFLTRHRVDDRDRAASLVEEVTADVFRARLAEMEREALAKELDLDATDAWSIDIRALLAYADAWDADVAAMREAVWEQEQEVGR